MQHSMSVDVMSGALVGGMAVNTAISGASQAPRLFSWLRDLLYEARYDHQEIDQTNNAALFLSLVALLHPLVLRQIRHQQSLSMDYARKDTGEMVRSRYALATPGQWLECWFDACDGALKSSRAECAACDDCDEDWCVLNCNAQGQRTARFYVQRLLPCGGVYTDGFRLAWPRGDRHGQCAAAVLLQRAEQLVGGYVPPRTVQSCASSVK